jgi:hypothetical protein
VAQAVTEHYPDRIGVGDGPGEPCRVVGVDFARAEAQAAADYLLRQYAQGAHARIRLGPDPEPLVTGHVDADGALHIDSVRTPRRLDHGEIVAHFSRLRPAAGFLVDISAPPNSCARCGTDQRGHDGDHAYTQPGDALRLARMRERRRARLDPPTAVALPEVFTTLAVDTARFTQAMQRLGEVITRSIEPLHAQLRSVAFTLRRSGNGDD